MAARKTPKPTLVQREPEREVDAAESSEDARFDRLFRPQRLADHEPLHVAASRTERHPHT